MTSFGQELKALRKRHGLTQEQLARRLGISRGTIAPVENDRDAATAQLYEALRREFPGDVRHIRPAYERARKEQAERRLKAQQAAEQRQHDDTSRLLGGPYVMERYDLVYVFGDSKSPQEILELRRVRALKHGAHDFGLKVEQIDSTKFETDTDVLFGGELVKEERRTPAGETLYLRRIDFGHKLRRSQIHHFAIRYWVERDPEPNDYIIVEMTDATQQLGVHLCFRAKRPKQVWQYGPVADDSMAPGAKNERTPLHLDKHGNVTASFATPELGTSFGIGWRWSE